MKYSLIIKDSTAEDAREAHISQVCAERFYNGDYSFKIHSILTHETVVLLEIPQYHERFLHEWFAEENGHEPPFPTGALLHWRPVTEEAVR